MSELPENTNKQPIGDVALAEAGGVISDKVSQLPDESSVHTAHAAASDGRKGEDQPASGTPPSMYDLISTRIAGDETLKALRQFKTLGGNVSAVSDHLRGLPDTVVSFISDSDLRGPCITADDSLIVGVEQWSAFSARRGRAYRVEGVSAERFQAALEQVIPMMSMGRGTGLTRVIAELYFVSAYGWQGATISDAHFWANFGVDQAYNLVDHEVVYPEFFEAHPQREGVLGRFTSPTSGNRVTIDVVYPNDFPRVRGAAFVLALSFCQGMGRRVQFYAPYAIDTRPPTAAEASGVVQLVLAWVCERSLISEKAAAWLACLDSTAKPVGLNRSVGHARPGDDLAPDDGHLLTPDRRMFPRDLSVVPPNTPARLPYSVTLRANIDAEVDASRAADAATGLNADGPTTLDALAKRSAYHHMHGNIGAVGGTRGLAGVVRGEELSRYALPLASPAGLWFRLSGHFSTRRYASGTTLGVDDSQALWALSLGMTELEASYGRMDFYATLENQADFLPDGTIRADTRCCRVWDSLIRSHWPNGRLRDNRGVEWEGTKGCVALYHSPVPNDWAVVAANTPLPWMLPNTVPLSVWAQCWNAQECVNPLSSTVGPVAHATTARGGVGVRYALISPGTCVRDQQVAGALGCWWVRSFSGYVDCLYQPTLGVVLPDITSGTLGLLPHPGVVCDDTLSSTGISLWRMQPRPAELVGVGSWADDYTVVDPDWLPTTAGRQYLQRF